MNCPQRMTLMASPSTRTATIQPRNLHLNLKFFLMLCSFFAIIFSKCVEANDVTNRATEGKVASSNNIYAMIVSSSRYWFNYRHAINALGIYEIYRQNGVPDENIILMIADEYAINPRNPYKNRMHASGINQPSWYANHTEIDYRGSDVTVQMFMDALLGDAPKSLNNLNENSRLMIYLAGHGGDQFFKFQDEEELMAQDIANLMDRMFEEKKFGSALFIAETCQAFTLFDKLTTPNVMAFGTSLTGESAYAHHADKDLGIAIIERWTHAFLANYEESNPKTTLYEAMFSPSEKKMLGASVGIKDDTSKHKFKDTKLSHFFGAKGGTSEAQVTNEMMKPKNTVINDSTNSLLDVSSSISSSWFQPQDLSASVSKKSSPKKKSLTASKLQQLGNGGRITRDNDIYYVFPTLLMVLILMKKLEQQWFSCYV